LKNLLHYHIRTSICRCTISWRVCRRRAGGRETAPFPLVLPTYRLQFRDGRFPSLGLVPLHAACGYRASVSARQQPDPKLLIKTATRLKNKSTTATLMCTGLRLLWVSPIASLARRYGSSHLRWELTVNIIRIWTDTCFGILAAWQQSYATTGIT